MKILRMGCVFGGFLSLVLSLPAQTFATLHSFDNKDGAFPFAGLVQKALPTVRRPARQQFTSCSREAFQISESGYRHQPLPTAQP